MTSEERRREAGEDWPLALAYWRRLLSAILDSAGENSPKSRRRMS
jgi:hypothetical protein